MTLGGLGPRRRLAVRRGRVAGRSPTRSWRSSRARRRGRVRAAGSSDLRDLPPARIVAGRRRRPRQLVAMAGDRLPARYRRRLLRFRHGPGVFKVDYALAGRSRGATTAVGAGGHGARRRDDAPRWRRPRRPSVRGEHPEAPFVLVAQPSRFDPTRAPAGPAHALGVHPRAGGSTVDMTARIEAQIERFAPGFRDLVIDRHVMAAGRDRGLQPQRRRRRHHRRRSSTGASSSAARSSPCSRGARRWSGLYLCSASTPPGAGVHGMCGFHAARCASVRPPDVARCGRVLRGPQGRVRPAASRTASWIVRGATQSPARAVTPGSGSSGRR